MIHFVRRPAAVLLLALAMSGLATGAAGAATPSPTPSTGNPIIQYSGTIDIVGSAGEVGTYPGTATIDCTTQPCVISSTVTAEALTSILLGDSPIPIPGGKASVDISESHSPCDDAYVGEGHATIEANAQTVVIVRTGTGSGQVDCPDGTTIQYDSYTATLTVTYVSGDTCYLTQDCDTATSQPVGVPVVPPADTYTGGTVATAPSTLSTLPTVASAMTLQNAAWAVAMTTVLVILIALPSHLINVTMEHGSERFAAWRQRRRGTAKVEAPTAGVSWKGWPLAAGGVLVASLISSFVNPAFGFNGSSVRVFFSILVSFLLDAVAGWFVVIWLVRRKTPTASAAFRFVPATLIIVAAAVLFSRLTGFQPGIVFGLVAGVVFGSALATAEKARVALAPLAYSFGAAVIGWVAYSMLVATAGARPVGVALFAKETFAAMAIAGIAALPIALIPLKGLAGNEVFSWNRWVWGASYAVGLFGFFFVLMPLPFSWESVSLSIWTWVGIYLAYALVAVVLWLAIVKPWRRSATTEAEDGPALVG